MRIKERIPIFMEKVNFKIYLDKFKISDDDKFIFLKNFNDNKNYILNIWLENQDMRFSQILIKLNILPNLPGSWYYIEDDDILIEQGISQREILFWGTYGKNGKQPFKWVLLKNMNTEHIKAVIITQKQIKKTYKKALNEEINLRRKMKLKKILNEI